MDENEKLIYPEESYVIRGAVMEVYKILGNGFLEAVYQECLELEFKRQNVPYFAQPSLALSYRGVILKQIYKPDFVCYSKIIVELKAISKVTGEHRAQVTNYLKAADFQLGFLINCGHYPLAEIVRIPNLKNRQQP